MKKRIFIKEWLELKPYDKQTITDSYYLKISNEVKKAILENQHSFELLSYFKTDEIDLFSCYLTSYFEDVISKTNIWNTFLQIHQRLYKKKLPFYNTNEHYEEEVNVQDICFLIWYYINTVQFETFVSPYKDFIQEIAQNVIEIFEKEWEYAPENEHLKTFYQINEEEKDFYVARKLIDVVFFQTYLFYPDTYLNLKDKEIEIIEKNNNKENILIFLNEKREDTIHRIHCRLFGFTGKEWVAEILGSNHKLHKAFLNISKRINGLFFYKGQDDKNIFIEHIASGKKFEVSKKSFDHPNSLKEIDSIMYMGIVKWKDEWWFSGVFFQKEFSKKIVSEEKNSLASRMKVSFLDHQKNDTDEVLQKQLSAFKDFNKGSQIAFMPSDMMEEFCKDFIEFYNNSLNLSEKENKETKNEGLLGYSESFSNLSEYPDTGLIFFNPKSGIEMAMWVNSAFPDSSNPYFKEEESNDDVMQLLIDESISPELVMYCIDNYKNKLSFFDDIIGKKYLENIDFLLRFWKNENYFTKPTISYIGEKK